MIGRYKRLGALGALLALMAFAAFAGVARADDPGGEDCNSAFPDAAVYQLTHTPSSAGIDPHWNVNILWQCATNHNFVWEMQVSTDGGLHWTDQSWSGSDIEHRYSNSGGFSGWNILNRTPSAGCTANNKYRLHVWSSVDDTTQSAVGNGTGGTDCSSG